jgi:hypothetical protein
MANIVIASNDPGCQSAKSWFMTNQHYVSGPPLDALKDNDKLVIIAHDAELGDGTALIQELAKSNFPMSANFSVVLIVCSAASGQFGSELMTPAERIANHFHRPVHAARGVVTGTWDPKGANFVGEFIVVHPDTDITSLLGRLSI